MKLPIYLDNAATTPVLPEVVEAMLPYFTELYGNSATLYSVGVAARDGVDTARETVAETMNATPDEIVFTSGGTESDNAAIWGIMQANKHRGRHMLTTPVEHHAVLEPMETLAENGFEMNFIPVDSEGRVDPDELAKCIRPDTVLVSVMHANNEIGTINPIAAIGALCRERGVYFHTDAVQTFGKVPIDVRAMKIDLLSLSAHKLHGPKGIGALFVRRGIPVIRFQEGGEQEKGRRGGTLNVPGIVGLGKAAEVVRHYMAEDTERLTFLRERLIAGLQTHLVGVRINGSRTHRLSFNVHLCIEGVDGEPILLGLDDAGICASAGSACSSGSVEPSHVLKAIGLDRETARGALRLTLGHETDAEAIDYTIKTLCGVVAGLRDLVRA